ncbi:hypothetical protein [Nitrosomonas communis]|uniref:hypothetical protein n=1 Tax=Nitrosomonas communis TaxID=44574 RepID=UPI003D2CCF2C
MNELVESVIAETQDISRTEIDAEQVRAFDAEADFIGLSISLLIEVGTEIKRFSVVILSGCTNLLTACSIKLASIVEKFPSY